MTSLHTYIKTMKASGELVAMTNEQQPMHTFPQADASASESDSDSDDDTEGSISLLVPRPMIRGPSIIDGGRIYTVDEFIMRDDGLFDVPITTTIPNQTSSTTDSETPRLEQETSISVPVQAEEFEVPRTPPRTLGTAPLSNASTTDARVTTTPIVFSSLSPSPPPSVTPRLYSWAPTSTRLPPPPLSPTTNRGPLTNRNARMSVAHIQPSFTASVNRVHV